MRTAVVLAAAVATDAFGQCVPIPNGCTPPAGGYCLSNAFEAATVGQNYGHSAQFFHAGWKWLPGDAVVYFRKIRLDSVSGLPQGLYLTIRSFNAGDGFQGTVYQGGNGPIYGTLSRVGAPVDGFAACFAVTGNPSVATYVHDSVSVHVTPFYSDLDDGDGIADDAGVFGPKRYTFKVPVVYNPDGEFYFGVESSSADYCTGYPVQLSAFADPPYGVNFRWEPAQYTLDPNVAQPIVFPPTTTVFTVTAFNELIEYSTTVTVQTLESPHVNLGPDLVLNPGETISLDAGPYGAFYLWNTGAEGRFLIVDAPGTYAVEVFAANGCWASDTVNVFAPGGFYLQTHPPVQIVCGSSVPVQLTLVPENAQVSVTWSPTTGVFPPHGLSVTLSPTQTTVYTVSATDGQTTFQTQLTAVVVSPLNLPPTLSFAPGESVVLDAGPALSYLWNTGETTRSIVADEQGEYWVQTDYENCPTGRDTVRVRVEGHVVSGRVYKDLNINSSYEFGEPGLKEIVVWAQSGDEKFYASTRSDGSYELYLPDGNWYVACRPPDYYGQTQPFSGGYSFAFSGEHQNAPATDFGFGELAVPFSDLRVNLFRRTPTPDFPAQSPSPLAIEYLNVGNHVQSGRVELRLDPKTTFFYASPYPDSQQPLRWDFDNLAPGEKRRIFVQILGETPSNSYLHQAEIFGVTQDFAPWDDVSICRYHTSESESANELTRRVGGGDSLNVRLAFFHTSAQPKRNVILRDTLNPVVPPEGIWNRISTHDGEFRVKGRGIVEWRFMNALLPPLGAEAGTGVGIVEYSAVARVGMNCSVPYAAAAGVRMDELSADENTFLPNFFNPMPEYQTVVPDSVEFNANVEFVAQISEGAEAAWNFGADAEPQSAAGPGPHSVRFVSVGPKSVVLSVWRGICRKDDVFNLYVKEQNQTDTVPDTLSRNLRRMRAAPFVYPNPVREQFWIVNARPSARWELFDVWGKKIAFGSTNNAPITAPPPGIYLLKVDENTIKLTAAPY
ncbi:MAG: T9SS type A sorting domain-containing protein [Bacteroidia bacterium]|nr:T9SS type A sorting domain-containing protein [Bacteroidia bacterium]